MAYRVLAVSSFAAELRDAPGELRGYVSAVVAVLRVDPTMASVAFSVVEERRRAHGDLLANGRGFLTYWAPRGRGMVVLLRLVWA